MEGVTSPLEPKLPNEEEAATAPSDGAERGGDQISRVHPTRDISAPGSFGLERLSLASSLGGKGTEQKFVQLRLPCVLSLCRPS